MSLYKEYLIYLQHKDFFDNAKSNVDHNELCWLTGNYTDECRCGIVYTLMNVLHQVLRRMINEK